LGSIVLFFVVMQLWMFMLSRNNKKISQLENQIESIEKEIQKPEWNLGSILYLKDNSSIKFLFQGLSDQGVYTKSFEEFKLKFNSQEKQIKLYNILKERELYTKSQEEFLSQKENVDISKEVLDQMNLKFNQGIVSSLDITSANNDYLTAVTDLTGTILKLLNSEQRNKMKEYWT